MPGRALRTPTRRRSRIPDPAGALLRADMPHWGNAQAAQAGQWLLIESYALTELGSLRGLASTKLKCQ